MPDEEEVRDPAGLLAAYNKLKEDIVAERTERKALEDENARLKENTDVDKWRGRAVKQEAKSRLVAEGIKDPDRIVKYLNFDGIDYDDDEKVTGLDERLDEVRKDFPELFDVKRRAGRNSVDLHADNPAEVRTDPLRQQVQRALSGAPN